MSNCHNLFIKRERETHTEREIRFVWWQHICNNIRRPILSLCWNYKIQKEIGSGICWFLNKRAFTHISFYSKHCTRRFIYRVQRWQVLHNFDDMCCVYSGIYSQQATCDIHFHERDYDYIWGNSVFNSFYSSVSMFDFSCRREKIKTNDSNCVSES